MDAGKNRSHHHLIWNGNARYLYGAVHPVETQKYVVLYRNPFAMFTAYPVIKILQQVPAP